MTNQPAYIVVQGDVHMVCRQVNHYMQEGYIPAGGLTYGDTGGLNAKWTQAMYKPQPAPVVNEEHKTILKEHIVDPTPQAMLHPAQRPDNVGEKGMTLRDAELLATGGLPSDGKTLLLLERAYRIAAGTAYTGDDSSTDNRVLAEILAAVETRTRYLIEKVREYSAMPPLETIDKKRATHAQLVELICTRVAQNDNLVCAAMAVEACMNHKKPQGMVVEFSQARAIRNALANYGSAQYQDPLVAEFIRLIDTGVTEAE